MVFLKTVVQSLVLSKIYKIHCTRTLFFIGVKFLTVPRLIDT